MGRSEKEQPATSKTHLVKKGQYGAVRLSDEAKAEFDALCTRSDETGIREAVTVKRYFERFAEKGAARPRQPQDVQGTRSV
jgi:hypothetical protein